LHLIEDLCGRFLALWCGLDKGASKLRLFFFVTLVVVCAVTAFTGAVPTLVDGHDDFFFLENGWRAFNGQVPHLDFWSPWGPLTYLITALGLKLGHESANALGYGNAVVAFCIGVWTYLIGRKRMAAAPRVTVALYATFLVCSPYPLGRWPPTMTSHAMSYNRLGYALVAILILECYQQPQKEDVKWEPLIGGFSTGVAAALTLFLKASYFMVAAALIVASLLLLGTSLRRMLGIIAGFFAVSFLGIAYLKFNAGAMFYALRMAAGARALSFSPRDAVWEILEYCSPLLVALCLGVAGAFLSPRRRGWLGDLYLPVLALLTCIADAALLTSNQQTSALPLVPVLALVVANLVAQSANDSPVAPLSHQLTYYVSILLICGSLFLPQFCSDAGGLVSGALRKSNLSAFGNCSVRFTEPRLAALALCDPRQGGEESFSNGSLYTRYVNDGTALLRQNCAPSDRVLTMDTQNPFPYALGWPPPRGGTAATSFNYTLSAIYRPSFDGYFGDATVVMLPKHPSQLPKNIDGFYKLYVPAMEQRFQLSAESDWFWLYKKK
jgi:hypothetical protein